MATADFTTLPPRIHTKNGGFYLVRKNKWHFLGREKSAAIINAANIQDELENGECLMMRQGDALEMRRYLARMWTTMQANARKRGIAFALTKADFVKVLERSRGFCEITQMPFSLSNPGQAKRKPFAPSVDRIDSAQGYSLENCRVVLYMVNVALSDWGLDVLCQIAHKLPSPIKSSMFEKREKAVKSSTWQAMTNSLRISCSAD